MCSLHAQATLRRQVRSCACSSGWTLEGSPHRATRTPAQPTSEHGMRMYTCLHMMCIQNTGQRFVRTFCSEPLTINQSPSASEPENEPSSSLAPKSRVPPKYEPGIFAGIDSGRTSERGCEGGRSYCGAKGVPGCVFRPMSHRVVSLRFLSRSSALVGSLIAGRAVCARGVRPWRIAVRPERAWPGGLGVAPQRCNSFDLPSILFVGHSGLAGSSLNQGSVGASAGETWTGERVNAVTAPALRWSIALWRGGTNCTTIASPSAWMMPAASFHGRLASSPFCCTTRRPDNVNVR
jgi:hypothetical protein